MNIAQTDIEIIHQYLKTQEPAYFSVLYSRYAGKVYGKCLSILKEEHWARDATQDIFMKIMLNLAAFNEKSQFSTWLYSISYNYCIDQIRKKKKDQKLFSADVEKAPDPIDEEVPDEYLMELDVQKLRLVLDMIPADDKIILLMKYQDDMSIKEIAEALDKTDSAIKMRIKRAKQKAKEICREYFKED